jgi:hypothetical protein
MAGKVAIKFSSMARKRRAIWMLAPPRAGDGAGGMLMIALPGLRSESTTPLER